MLQASCIWRLPVHFWQEQRRLNTGNHLNFPIVFLLAYGIGLGPISDLVWHPTVYPRLVSTAICLVLQYVRRITVREVLWINSTRRHTFGPDLWEYLHARVPRRLKFLLFTKARHRLLEHKRATAWKPDPTFTLWHKPLVYATGQDNRNPWIAAVAVALSDDYGRRLFRAALGFTNAKISPVEKFYFRVASPTVLQAELFPALSRRYATVENFVLLALNNGACWISSCTLVVCGMT